MKRSQSEPKNLNDLMLSCTQHEHGIEISLSDNTNPHDIGCIEVVRSVSHKTVKNSIKTVLAPTGSVPENFELYGDFGETPCLICARVDYKIASVFGCGHFVCDICLDSYLSYMEKENCHQMFCPYCRQQVTQVIYYIIERPHLSDEDFKILDLLCVSKKPKTRMSEDSYRYSESHITDKLNPCTVELKTPNTTLDSSKHIAFLLDVSGSMYSCLNDVKQKLLQSLKCLDKDTYVSVDTFNHHFKSVVDPLKIEDSFDNLEEKVNSITSSGGTKLGKALKNVSELTLPKWSNFGVPTIVIITDGETDDLVESCKNFKHLKEMHNIFLLGFGSNYKYDNCIEIVERNACDFDYVSTSNELASTIVQRLGKPLVKISIMGDRYNQVITGAQSSTHNLLFESPGTDVRIATTNGLPRILINDAEIILTKDEGIDSELVLFEFLLINMINKIGSEVNYKNALRMKLKIKEIMNYVNSRVTDVDVIQRLKVFSEEIKNLCQKEFVTSNNFNLHFHYTGRETSNELSRAVSVAIKDTYRRVTC